MASAHSDLEFCKQITRKGGSNLWLVSKALPSAKKDLFAACYASMRYIDDYVDEEFQTLSPKKRDSVRDEALQHIDQWEEQASIALRGQPVDSGYELAPVFRALSQTAGLCNLGNQCWRDLARAMRADIQEEVLKDWADFASYAEGATVSPTEIYLYILLAKQDPASGGFHYTDITSLRNQSRDMAIFCYLVHIARDLKKDMQTGGRLLTVPVNLHDQTFEKITKDVIEQAQSYKSRMQHHVSDLKSRMERRERLIFTSLLGIYENLFERMRKKKDISGQTIEEESRKRVIATLSKLEDLPGS